MDIRVVERYFNPRTEIHIADHANQRFPGF